MQKKLLYCGALCALFSASNMVFGMDPNFTALVLHKKENPDKFWGLAIPKSNDIQKEKWASINPPANFISNDTNELDLIITDCADGNRILSVINKNQVTINLGTFHKKRIEELLEKKASLEKTTGLSLRTNDEYQSICKILVYNPTGEITDTIQLKDVITIPDASKFEKKESDDKTPDTNKLDKTKKPTIPTIKTTKHRWILGLGILAVISSLYYFLKIRTA